jgi:hypothetical protein
MTPRAYLSRVALDGRMQHERTDTQLSKRVTTIMTQKTGSTRSFANAPEVPDMREAPRVTKLPVTCAVKSPCNATYPAVST